MLDAKKVARPRLKPCNRVAKLACTLAHRIDCCIGVLGCAAIQRARIAVDHLHGAFAGKVNACCKWQGKATSQRFKASHLSIWNGHHGAANVKAKRRLRHALRLRC